MEGMGRLILLLLIVAAVILVWKAFGPGTWGKRSEIQADNRAPSPKQIKGPDDDEEFLWNIEKQRFKERRAREAREAEQRRQQERQRRQQPPQDES